MVRVSTWVCVAILGLAGCDAAPPDVVNETAQRDAALADAPGATEAAPDLAPDDVPAAPPIDGEHDHGSATSLELVDGKPGDAEAIRTLLFSDSGVLEESIAQQSLGGKLAMLALGRTDVAGFVIYVLMPVATQPDAGKTRYQVASLIVPEPPGVIGAQVGAIEWQPAATGAALALPIAYDMLRAGANADAGQPETFAVEQRVTASFDAGAVALRRTDD